MTSDLTLPRFSLTGPLPSGTAVLEASAGTGKTYAIAALATRYVAEAGVPLDQLLLVTFTRAATAELGDRVRRRLREAATHLEGTLRGERGTSDDASTGDELLDHLGAASRAERERRFARLTTAITTFDTATIATIHGFCQQMLRAIGLAASVDRDATLLEDQDELLEQVVADLLVQRFHAQAGAPGALTARHALAAAMGAADALVLPEGAPTLLPPLEQLLGADAAEELEALEDPGERARRLASLVRDARDEAQRRKDQRGLLSQDDLLTRLRDALLDPVTGATATAAIRQRVRVALVDEFQDTDPVQWAILQAAFARPGDARDGRALVLIGDPKQSIYGFRGADVRAYLDATTAADRRESLGTNHRSDGPLVAALDGLLAGTAYGEREIVHRPVDARHGARLHATDPDDALPLELRTVVGSGPKGEVNASIRDDRLADDVAAEVVATLQQRGLTITTDDGETRPVRAGDIAVLVRANRDGPPIQRALRLARVPSVLGGVGNVFASEAADAWQALLDAVDRPNDQRLARRFAACGFGGWDGARFDGADDAAWDELHTDLAAWADIVRSHGVAALLRAVSARTDLPSRLLRSADGERFLTDVRHLAQLLERARLEEELGLAALRSWLEQHRAEADDTQVPPDAQARRLESDQDAVQILTIHRAKGLEFPIVLCPTLWSARPAPSAPFTVHDPDRGRRVVEVGPGGRDDHDALQTLAKRAQQGEDLRLLYVALTRARHRVVVWWAAVRGAKNSALGQVLFAREDGRVTDAEPDPPDNHELASHLDELVRPLGGRAVPVALQPEVPVHEPEPSSDAPLEVAELDAAIDRSWRRTSYSGLTAGLSHHGPVEPGRAMDAAPTRDHDGDGDLVDDEPQPPEDAATDDVPATPVGDPGPGGELVADDGRRLASVPLPLAELRGSAAFGTMVHAVLEHVDFAADDLQTELAHHVDREVQRAGLDVDRRLLVRGLAAAIHSPLGPLADGLALRDVTRADRLDEPRFELPVAGGDRSDGRSALRLSDVGGLLERHLAPDDPLAPYAARLHDPALHLDVRGYLNGAIDLVLRLRGQDGTPRYLVVDHKTNRLGWPSVPTAADYRPAALATAMMDSHYPLQALLYSVALHRLLAWRQPGYDPDQHLGGIAYLFLRGMTGPDVPHVDGQPCGVFAWRPPTPLLLDLDALVAGRLAGAGATDEVA
jgi:exodeoxyribonuclease V beta subunit